MLILLRDPCDGGDSCCRRDNVCKEGQFTPSFQISPAKWAAFRGTYCAGEGDCDSDTDCEGDLKCGKDNCRGWDANRLSQQLSKTLTRLSRHTANQSLLQVRLRLNRRLLPQPTAALGRALRGRRFLLHLGQTMLWRLRERPSYWTRINTWCSQEKGTVMRIPSVVVAWGKCFFINPSWCPSRPLLGVGPTTAMVKALMTLTIAVQGHGSKTLFDLHCHFYVFKLSLDNPGFWKIYIF